MIWYSAQALYKSIKDNSIKTVETDTYEESIFLIKASTKAEAYEIAERKAAQNEISYKNSYDQEVTWKFIKIIDVFELIDEKIDSGTEVFSRFIVVPRNTELREVLNRFYQEE